MKIAIVVEAAGAPGVLASTSFVGGLWEGLTNAGADALVVGLTRSPALWKSEALGDAATVSPWLAPRQPERADRVEAVRTGVFDRLPGACDCRATQPETWFLELLFQREVDRFFGTSNAAIIVYSRSQPVLAMCVRVAHRLGCRVLVSSNEALTDAQIDPETRDAYVQCVVGCTDGVLAVSDHLARFWQSAGLNGDHVRVNPLYVRRSMFESGTQAVQADTAVYLGNLAHREIDHLMDITESVVRRVPGFCLKVYGDASEDARARLTSAVATRGLESALRVESPVAPHEVPRVLCEATVLLLPRSRGEFSMAGFPNKLGEYLASGRPVVTTSVGDIPRYLVHGESALLVEPDDNEAFAEAVIRLLDDREFAARIGANGREVAERAFRADAGAARVLAFIGSLPGRGRGQAPKTPSVRWNRAIRTLIDVEESKRRVVRVLRALGLKPPAPDTEKRPIGTPSG